MLEALGNILAYVGGFIAALSIVVVVHELGHFHAARACKIAVDTFAIGFGGTLFGWRDKEGVLWKVGAIPIGGYVRFKDDADVISSHPSEAYANPAALAEARARGMFHAQPVGARAFVTVAGPLANFVFAILAFALAAMIFGRDVTPAKIGETTPGSAAALAGVQTGDVITELGGEKIPSYVAMYEYVRARPGQYVEATIVRGGETLVLPITIGTIEELDATGISRAYGRLGVRPGFDTTDRVREPVGPVEALGLGVGQTWDIVAKTGAYIGNIFSGKASAEHISGPAGIMSESGKVVKGAVNAERSLLENLGNLALSVFTWAAILSVAVGIVNLLPVPVLDGGHLVFYAVEAARGRPLSPRTQEIGFRAGLALILSLFLFATWNDIQRLNLLELMAGMLS
jgi:regulator of sigma E protease